MIKDVIYTLGNNRIDKEIFKKILKSIRLKVTDEYDYPPVVISVGDTTVGTIGNFSASTGKPKSKKTYNVSAIVAAAISGKTILKYKVTLPKSKKKVLYVDTEQGKYHCHKVLERILTLAGLPTDKETELIDFYVLREYTAEQRCDIINEALKQDLSYGLVIIDGIRDLVKDINSSNESQEVMNDLMRWSACYDLHIHTVLHLNKADDNTRGHLGTELNNKGETILMVTKCKENPNMSEVRATHIRDKEFQPFAFQINRDKLPELVSGYSPAPSRVGQISFTKFSDSQHREAIELAIGENEPQSYSQMLETITRGYSEYGYERGRCTMVSILKLLVNKNLIIKTGKTYCYNAKED